MALPAVHPPPMINAGREDCKNVCARAPCTTQCALRPKKPYEAYEESIFDIFLMKAKWFNFFRAA
jgi:hypothetical protein